MKRKNKFLKRYFLKSRHSHYQMLHPLIKKMIKLKDFSHKSHFEKERLDYILKKIPVKNKTILEIGGNYGYFSIDIALKGAKRIFFYEGNKNFARLVKLFINKLKLSRKVIIKNYYYKFSSKSCKRKCDLILLLNVLHHIRIKEKYSSLEKIKKTIIKYINNLSRKTAYLVLQIGFNWQGNIKKPLFKSATKKEMINFIKQGTENYWSIFSIGVPVKIKNEIKYIDLNKTNIKRNDELGEFLNRPLFILKSKYEES